MSTQQMMITRWPPNVRDRHPGKVTIYGWSTRRAASSDHNIISVNDLYLESKVVLSFPTAI
jgi:hypothetical protein